MYLSTNKILESKYFSPAFNTAIFDGPVKLYFSQHQESEALKVYFKLQTHFKSESKTDDKAETTTNTVFKNANPEKTIFIMLYPNKESFVQSFDLDKDIVVEEFENDIVLGIQSPVSENIQSKLLNNIEFLIGDLDFK